MPLLEEVAVFAQERGVDRGEDEHYDPSALIKSMRGNDPDASVYWLAKMLAGGEDPRPVGWSFLPPRMLAN